MEGITLNYALYGLIALGGALGALARYFFSNWITNKSSFIFPWGTFSVNVLGCFILGFIYVLGTEKLMINASIRTFLTVGFLGAFTTFSTFSLDTLKIMMSGEIKIAFLYMMGSVGVGLTAAYLGMVTAGLIVR